MSWPSPSPSRSSPSLASGGIDQLIAQAPTDAWQTLSCGNGAKGPRVYDGAAAKLPVNLVFDPEPAPHHRWVPARRRLSDPSETAYNLAYAPVDAGIAELARVAGSRWAIEECFQAVKNECGLDQYEVRRYPGWYRHITLALLAHALLVAMTAQDPRKGGRGNGSSGLVPLIVAEVRRLLDLAHPPRPGTGHPRGGSTGPAGADATGPSPAAARTSAAASIG